MFEELVKIARCMKNQDNRCTAHPIFMVQERRRIYGMDPIWDGKVVWLLDGEEIPEGDEDRIVAEKYYEEHLKEPDDWTRTGYIDIWESVQPFFSEKAANDYIRSNKHRLTEPRVYVDSAYRNYEWQAVLEILNTLEDHVTKEEFCEMFDKMMKERELKQDYSPFVACTHWFGPACSCGGTRKLHWKANKE